MKCVTQNSTEEKQPRRKGKSQTRGWIGEAAAAGVTGAGGAGELGGDVAAEAGDEAQDWRDMARRLGLTAEQEVWCLHVARGRPLVEVARVLELPFAQVESLYAQRLRSRGERAGDAAGESQTARWEELWDRLVATYEALCGSLDPRVLPLRVKALDQMFDFLERRAACETAAQQMRAPQAMILSEEDRDAAQLLAVEANFGRGREVLAARQAVKSEV